MPSVGFVGARCTSPRHITQRTRDSASRSEKYQCPLRCDLKSLISPRTHSGENAPSITSFAARVSVVIASAVSGASPGYAVGAGSSNQPACVPLTRPRPAMLQRGCF